MRDWVTILLLPVVLALLASNSESSEISRLLKRQSSEAEQEATTQAVTTQGLPTGTAVTQQPARLYPDLPKQQPNVAFLPPFNARPFPPGSGPAPFVPFGFQMPAGRLNESPFGQVPPQMRPMNSGDRMQSQTFVNGLGRRLLSMIGIDTQKNMTDNGNAAEVGAQMAPMNGDELMRALRNSSVLQQLNSGVHSVYGSLSKMYNSTVQQQLNILRDRFKRESENSTNPWQRQMAQQVPQFFKAMAMKVEDAQQNLNRIWRQITQANNGSMPQQNVAATRSFFDNSMGQGPGFNEQTGNFFSQLGRQFGMGGDSNMANGRQDFGGQLMDFWHNQVQPQIGMVRGQVARIWRDLTTSGALMPESMRSRNVGSLGAEKPSEDIVDSVLKEVEASGPEYTLIQPAGSNQQAAGSNYSPTEPQAPSTRGRTNPMTSQMQNRLIAMQREINQLWNGLSNSLQNALSNVRGTMNPRGNSFESMSAQGSNNQAQPDPAENEISDRIQDLNKIQRDADSVYSTVQRQQNQMQRPSFADRFMNFFNNMDIDQFQDRIGSTVNRFGSMVGNLWNQIPERWDNFMQQNRGPQEVINARLTASSTTQKPSSPVTNDS